MGQRAEVPPELGDREEKQQRDVGEQQCRGEPARQGELRGEVRELLEPAVRDVADGGEHVVAVLGERGRGHGVLGGREGRREAGGAPCEMEAHVGVARVDALQGRSAEGDRGVEEVGQAVGASHRVERVHAHQDAVEVVLVEQLDEAAPGARHLVVGLCLQAGLTLAGHRLGGVRRETKQRQYDDEDSVHAINAPSWLPNVA